MACFLSYQETFIYAQPVTLQLAIEEEYDEPTNFSFDVPPPCPDQSICLKITKNADSITFEGILTEVPKGFTATLASDESFVFSFGGQTSTQKTDSTTSITSSAGADESSATESDNTEVTTPNGVASTASDVSDSDLTTSSGEANFAPIVTFLLAFSTSMLA